MRHALLLLFLASPVAASDADDAAAALALAAARRHAQEQVAPAEPTTRVTDYERIYARVLAGERVTVMVGVYGLDGYPGKIAAGQWTFWLRDGQVVMQRVEVAAPGPFPTPGITAPPAVVPSTSSPAISRMGGIRILAPSMGRFGRIENCGPLG